MSATVIPFPLGRGAPVAPPVEAEPGQLSLDLTVEVGAPVERRDDGPAIAPVLRLPGPLRPGRAGGPSGALGSWLVQRRLVHGGSMPRTRPPSWARTHR